MMYQVLLVDDEYMILQGLKRIVNWQELGFEVAATANSAEKALEILKSIPIDVVITDVTMPGKSGLDLLKEVNQLFPKIKSLIISGYQEFDYIHQGMELGIQSYLVKPIDKEELKQKLAEIKDLLDQEEIDEVRDTLYYESIIKTWLNDELNEHEFMRFCQVVNHYQPQNGYRAMILKVYKADKEITIDSIRLMLKEWRKVFFVIDSRVENSFEITIVSYFEPLEELRFIDGCREFFGSDKIRIFAGEVVGDWENLYESYHQVKKVIFYNESPQNLGNKEKAIIEVPKSATQFLGFNKALMIGDKETILATLQNIFTALQIEQVSPEDARHIAFLLFSDMYRHYSYLSEGIYQKSMDVIRQSKTIDQIYDWLSYLLISVVSDKQPIRYSALTMQVIAVLNERFNEDLALKNIADDLHVNSVYLGQVFKKDTEQSFSQYLNQVRIKKAQKMLLDTEKNINEIAFATGYNTNHYFIKMFKKLNGLSPKEFRAKYQGRYKEVQ
ncbi:two component transcriptional regulator, AraC family [Granulicatella balaenopterae]|uniref:Two component transcriptional regulator, AraC family n=1 Tax=Granulicatella balaenopterae TaxID=137733 RepID=A0A1H9KCM6_9LACT|nr:response regulator transcription factor [Granulicatella balaenopterae]SEQ96956.1 two component transcriptional regulator, AraC family [Granulicatella balaenopterae]